jgi:Glycosyltransferase family 9 (heptosyltransferase)
MKRAIVTIASGEYFQQMARLTHPTIRAYADRVGADFLVWTDTSAYKYPEYKKMEIGALLNTYDRVLYLDTDVIIRPDAPDIFNVVPEDSLGILEESRYFDRAVSTVQFMTRIGFNAALWNGKYYNAGIYVCSRCHQDLFVKPPTEWDHFRDQSWFNTLISDRKIKIFPLPHRFNRFVLFDRIFGEERLDAWFLHYAGFHVEGERAGVLDLIADDLAAWREAAPRYHFPHNVAFTPQGDLADQVAAEPVVRYARDVIYRGDNLVLVSSRPEIFAHLGLPMFDRFEQVPKSPKYHRRYTREIPDERRDFSPHQMHGTNLASYLALGLELPTAHKTPRLGVGPAALLSVREKIQPVDAASLVLLHPGRGAAANTFPPDVWASYLNVLADCGFRVAVVGNRVGDELGVVEFDRSRGIDLVDRLTLAELIALVSEARVLVTNDSAPVQIAGAFDGWIGLLATGRHPEYVLPWRNGSQCYRTKNLARAEMWADFFHKPSGSNKPLLDVCRPERLRQCLPEPAAVHQFVQQAFAEK